MKNSIKILALAFPLALSGCTDLAAVTDSKAGLATDSQLKRCELLNEPDKMEDAYQTLLDEKWDRNAVGCGAVYAYELARDSSFNIERKLEAVVAQLSYFEVLNNAYPKLYKSGALGDELNELWRATRKRTSHLLASVEIFDGFIPEVNLLKGAYILASAEQDASDKEALRSMPLALKLIKDTVADRPDVADGFGLYLLARLKLNLPSFIGGDTEQAVALFKQAITHQPNSLEFHRWLLQAYAATGEVEKEKQIISKVATLFDDKINDQDLADLYKVYGGSAHRYGMEKEIAFYSASRKALLANKPYLLTRKTGANRGHGGNDPITGTDPNAI